MMRNAMILIAVIIIGILILGPSFMSGISDLGESLGDWVKYGWENGEIPEGNGEQNGEPNGNGDNKTEAQDSEGQLCMGVTVQFKDGTQTTVGPEEMTFTLFPMTIYFEGKEVDQIWWHCYVLVDWVGDIENLKLSGPMKVVADGVTLRKEGMLKQYGTTEGDLPKNEWFDMWKFGLDAFDIEYSLGGGDFTLESEAIVKAEVTFSDAHKEEYEATATASLPITIEEGTLTVFSVEIQTEVMN